VPVSLTASVTDPLFDLACAGAGEIEQPGVMTILWPASHFHVPNIRAFVDRIARHVGAGLERG
jgi:hypothetical protein